MDVNAIDLAGADGDAAELERTAAENVKRVVRGDAERPEPVGDRVVSRAEDGLAPDRALSGRAVVLRSPGVADRRRLSESISEGDGISILVEVGACAQKPSRHDRG